MLNFCLWEHPELHIALADVRARRRDHTKDGFRLRYTVPIPEGMRAHAEDVISMLDDAMGPRTKAHGVYQAPYSEVRAAYGALLPPPARRGPHLSLRCLAVLAAALLLAAQCFLLLPLFFLFVTVLALAGRHVSLFEAGLVRAAFDLRPVIRALARYVRGQR